MSQTPINEPGNARVDSSLSTESKSVDHRLATGLVQLQQAFETLIAQLPGPDVGGYGATRHELAQFHQRVSHVAAGLASKADSTPQDVSHDHSAFGILKGRLELDGVACSDGLEYQNRIRSEW